MILNLTYKDILSQDVLKYDKLKLCAGNIILRCADKYAYHKSMSLFNWLSEFVVFKSALYPHAQLYYDNAWCIARRYAARLKVISAFNHGISKLFHNINENRSQFDIVWEYQCWLIILDKYPQVDTHFLIIHKYHNHEHMSQVDSTDIVYLLEVINYLSHEYSKLFRLLINTGSYQHIKKLHIHFLADNSHKRM